MRRVGVDTVWVALLTTGTVLLMVFLRDAGAQPTSYHIALPTMPAVFTTSAKVAVLHSSALTTGQPSATTPVAGCNVATGNPIVLDSDCVDLLPRGVGVDTVGIHVTHTDPFRLHVIPTSPDGTTLGDGFLAVPDIHLGDEYFVVTYCSLDGQTCQFSIVGTIDNTSVSVAFPMNVDTAQVCIGGSDVISPGTETPFTLHENDVLHFESSFDLSGTHITSDQKVAVFSGGYDDVNNNGQLYEQLLPTRKWSKSYVIMPNDLNDAGDIVKIMPLSDFTEIHITGYSTFMMPEAGKAIERRIDWRMFSEITATKPIQAMQIMGIDLYNDTANVGGPRAMVHLQSRNQWLNTGTLACSNDTDDVTRSMISTVGNSTFPPPVLPFRSRTGNLAVDIQGTNIGVFVFDNADGETDIYEPTLGTFTYGQVGYCVYGNNKSASAMLLSNDLDDDDSVRCSPSLSTPGDDLDNDCDERHDEEVCVLADLTISHNSVEDSNGYSSQYSRKIGFDGYMKFKVQTCHIAEVLMWCSTKSGPHVSLQIFSTGLNLHVDGGKSESFRTKLNSTCSASQAFWLQWTHSGSNVNIKAGSGILRASTSISVTTADDCFDWLTFHSLSGNASFEMESGKDCGKIISGPAADNYGFEFVVPIPNDHSFKLYVTGINDAATGVYLRHPEDVALAYTGKTVGGSLTIETSNDLTTTEEYTHLILTADAEVSVFATGKTTDTYGFGVHLLPMDVLGPAYPSAQLEATNTVCRVYSTDRQLDIADVSPATVKEFMSENYTQNAEDPRLFFNAKQVMPVFCGDFKTAVMQIPPRESMGRNFYVPKISFGGAARISNGWISIVTLEDNTYVKILGEYDHENIVDLRYTHYTRQLRRGANKYTIETNKNVLAYLELKFYSDSSDVITLPPTDQYKNKTRFPATGGIILGSWAISDVGALIDDSQLTDSRVASPVQTLTYESPTFMVAVVEIDSVNWAITNAGALIDDSQLTDKSVASSVQTLNYASPTFMVAVVEIDNVKHIMTSDFGLVDNEMCVISDIPKEGTDDDCDGLVDEDVCYAAIVPGKIDSDIDGAINDDCDPTAQYDPFSIPTPTLNINKQHIECGGDSTTAGTVPTSGSPTVPTTPMPITTTTSLATAPTLPTETLPMYAPIDFMENATASVSINITTSGSNSSATPSLCDGVCPCSWVDPPNMTDAELKAKVKQIQEKLKIKKTDVSAWVRKKTSAQNSQPSAKAVGTAGLLFFVVCMAAILILDMTTLARDFTMMRDNLRQAFTN